MKEFCPVDAVQGMTDAEFNNEIIGDNRVLRQLKEAGMVPGAHVVIDAGKPEEREVEIRSLRTEFYRAGRSRRYKVMVSYWTVSWNKPTNKGRNNRSDARVFLERGTLKR